MRPLDAIRCRLQRLSGRSKAVGLFFVTSLTARAIGIGCQLVQVPIAVTALGPEAFGLWMALTSIGTMIMFADFGMGQSVQNRLSEAFAAHDERRARELLGSVGVLLAFLGALIVVAVRLAGPELNFTRLFDLSDPVVRVQAPQAITLALQLFGLNVPLALAQRLAYSRQRGWMLNIAQGIASLCALGGVVLAAHLRASLATFILAGQAPLVAANGGLLLVQLVQLGWCHSRALRCRWSVIRELFGLGACFGIQQVQLVLLVSLPQVVISTALGAAAVTPYNLAQRLFNLFAIIQNAFMLPLWPAYSDAKARGEFGWIRRTLLFSIRATLLGAVAPMILGAWFARPILTLWVGHAAPLPTPALIWLLFGWNTLVFLQQDFGYLLAGLSEVRRLTAYAVVSTLAVASLMSILVHRYGREGVVAGMIIGFLPYLLLGNLAEIIRVFRHLDRRAPPAEALPETPPAQP